MDEEQIKEIFITFNNNLTKEDIESLFNDEDETSLRLQYFNKIISNHKSVLKTLSKIGKENFENIEDIIDFENSNELANFNRAWFYIKDLNLKDKSHISSILNYANLKVFKKNLVKILKFYERKESYERCAHLFSIFKKIKFS